MDERTRIWGILLAAGRGTRFGREKHDLELGGVPLWQHSHRALLDGGVDTLVVVGDLDGWVSGGDRRQDSVAAGLSQIPDHDGFVLIHDAARPLLSADLVESVITRLRIGDVDGVIPAVAVKDTIKRVAGEWIVETVDRSELVAVQTPQGFNLRVLRAAHEAAGFDATDDAAMVEANGGSVVFVEGDPANIKVTYPEDLPVAEALRSRDYE
ncbi:MAG: 2-C-methyl-D-erythritol 4-phosphate cytidylyltransferase [Acidimicrobiia bacterium]